MSIAESETSQKPKCKKHQKGWQSKTHIHPFGHSLCKESRKGAPEQ